MENKIKNNCEYCKGEYHHDKSHKSKYCSSTCRTKASIQRKVSGIENIDYVVCGICKLKFKEINADHLVTHNLNKEEYDNKFGNRVSDKTRLNKNTWSGILTPELSKKLSDSHTIEGYINKYGKEIGSEKHADMIKNKTYKNSVDSYIEKYGSSIGLVEFNKVQNKKVISLENQIKLYGLADGTKKYNQWKLKQKNKNTISYYIELYGYEDGLTRWFARNNRISIANSKIGADLKNDYKLYCISVDKFTRISLQIYDLENIHLRGFKHGYDLDHRVSKIHGFKNSIQPQVIGHISNLKIITSTDNRKKQHKSNLDISDILIKYNNDSKYLEIINIC